MATLRESKLNQGLMILAMGATGTMQELIINVNGHRT